MKQPALLITALTILQSSTAQVSGNINYINGVRYAENNIDISLPSGKNLLITAAGMANVKADSCVAIFSITQTGKTAEEVNTLMDSRINPVLEQAKSKSGIRIYVDIISFVPMYEYEADKKVFSKRTYNEVPVGFEMKKNLHVKYNQPADLHILIGVLATAEIYDLVRVDYFSNSIEALKKELMNKARVSLQEKMKNYQLLLNIKLDTLEKQLADGYRVVLPAEMYKSYQAYNSSPLQATKAKAVNQAEKSTTLYYQPIIDKEFDFVLNPVVFEPVIQVMYEIKLNVELEKPKPVSNTKELILITPNGDLKPIDAQAMRQW